MNLLEETLMLKLIYLINVVKNDVAKKTVYDKVVTKVNSVGTTSFVSKTKYNTDKLDLENKISDAGNKLVKKERFKC